VGDVMGTVEVDVYNMISQSLLPYATGSNLDLIGAIFGVPRLPQSNAIVIADDDNFEFYVRTGTFGAINSGSSITIPAGVILSSSSPTGPTFTVTSTTI